MENLKIKVNTEAESKEVQELFSKLGYNLVNNIACENGFFVASLYSSGINFDYWADVKEITIQELRDMVVLKCGQPTNETECLLQGKNGERLLESIEQLKEDNVNHPSHYASGGIECIDAMIAAYGIEAVKQYCKLNAFKYQWRFDKKNGNEDILKCQWYQNKYMELSNEV